MSLATNFFTQHTTFPDAHVYDIVDGPLDAGGWMANDGQAVTDVTCESGVVTGVRTVDSFIAREKGESPARIPLVPTSDIRPLLTSSVRRGVRLLLGCK